MYIFQKGRGEGITREVSRKFYSLMSVRPKFLIINRMEDLVLKRLIFGSRLRGDGGPKHLLHNNLVCVQGVVFDSCRCT